MMERRVERHSRESCFGGWTVAIADNHTNNSIAYEDQPHITLNFPM